MKISRIMAVALGLVALGQGTTAVPRVDMKALRAAAEEQFNVRIYDRVADIPGYEKAPLDTDLEKLIRMPVVVEGEYIFYTYDPETKRLSRGEGTVKDGKLTAAYHHALSMTVHDPGSGSEVAPIPGVTVKAGDEAAATTAAIAGRVREVDVAQTTVEKFAKGWMLVQMPRNSREGRSYYTVAINPAGELLDVKANLKTLFVVAAQAFGTARTQEDHAAHMKFILHVQYPWITEIASTTEVPKAMLDRAQELAKTAGARPPALEEIADVIRPPFRVSDAEETYVCYGVMTGQSARLDIVRCKFYFSKGQVDHYEFTNLR